MSISLCAMDLATRERHVLHIRDKMKRGITRSVLERCGFLIKEGTFSLVFPSLTRSEKNKIARISQGYTLLHVAARHSRVRAARMLMENGADPNVVGAYPRAFHRCRPLHEAAAAACEPMLLLLLGRGADRGAVDGLGRTVQQIVLEHKKELSVVGVSPRRDK